MTIGPDEVDSASTAASLLYGLAAESFVAARDELVKALRAGGQRDLATEVKALRRPGVIAAELNRALRTAPGEREALIEAATVLARGHHQLLAGEQVDLAGLQRAHRAAVAAVAAHAAAHQAEVHAALEAASLDESLHSQLRAATFAVEPAPARGFDLLSPAAVPPRANPAAGARLRGERPRLIPSPAERRPAAPAPAEHPRLIPSPAESRPAAPAPAEHPRLIPSPAERRPAAQDQAARRVMAAETARDQAARRVTATEAARDQAARRITDLEARLAEARAHHDVTHRRHREAEAALARAEATLAAQAPGPLRSVEGNDDRSS